MGSRAEAELVWWELMGQESRAGKGWVRGGNTGLTATVANAQADPHHGRQLLGMCGTTPRDRFLQVQGQVLRGVQTLLSALAWVGGRSGPTYPREQAQSQRHPPSPLRLSSMPHSLSLTTPLCPYMQPPPRAVVSASTQCPHCHRCIWIPVLRSPELLRESLIGSEPPPHHHHESPCGHSNPRAQSTAAAYSPASFSSSKAWSGTRPEQ